MKSVKRIVDTDFWIDSKVEEFTPEDRYFWLYLLTNPYTTQLGIYKITLKQAAFQLGYSIDATSVLFDRFEHTYGMIKYIDGELAIKNFLRHSIIKGGKPVEDCLKQDLAKVKHKSLVRWVFGAIGEDEGLNITVKNVITHYSINDNDNDNDNDNERIVHDSSTIRTRFVPPSKEELENFIKEQALNVDAEAFIDYYGSKGWMVGKSKMKDWKAAARNWSRRQGEYQPKADRSKMLSYLED